MVGLPKIFYDNKIVRESTLTPHARDGHGLVNPWDGLGWVNWVGWAGLDPILCD